MDGPIPGTTSLNNLKNILLGSKLYFITSNPFKDTNENHIKETIFFNRVHLKRQVVWFIQKHPAYACGVNKGLNNKSLIYMAFILSQKESSQLPPPLWPRA